MFSVIAAAAIGVAAMGAVGLTDPEKIVVIPLDFGVALMGSGATDSTFAVSTAIVGSGWRAGSLTGAVGTAVSGVPSTGQKLNLSANSSWHVLRNFIFSTSLSRVGLNAISDTEPPLLLC